MSIILDHYHPPHSTLPKGMPLQGQINLSFDARSKSRLKLNLPSGEVIVNLPRGSVIRGGAMLSDGAAFFVGIHALDEPLLRVRAATPLKLLQAAYHLGNRHVKLEIHADYLQLEPDNVLADMLKNLGATVESCHAPFEPDMGAYGGGHQHGHEATYPEDYALAQAAFHHHHH